MGHASDDGRATPRAKKMGRVRTGLLLFGGVILLGSIHALALAILDPTAFLFALLGTVATFGVWVWTTGTRRLVAICLVAVTTVVVRENLLPYVDGPQQLLGLILGMPLGMLNVREIEFWRRLRSAEGRVEWPRWRVLRPNVYLRVTLALLVTAALVFVARQYRERDQREQLIAAIDAAGGKAYVENRSPGFSRLPRRDVRQLLRRLGIDWWFDRVGTAYLGSRWRRGVFDEPKWIIGPTSSDWRVYWAPDEPDSRPVPDLTVIVPGLAREGNNTLTLSGDNVTDDDLAACRALRTSRHIEINCPKVTDRGLMFLSQLDDLQWLDLAGTALTGDALLAIPAGSGITHLCVDYTQVDDRALDSLVNMPSLVVLGLRGTRVTDAGVAKIVLCTRLDTVDLGNTAVTDRGVQQLASLPGLSWLGLDGCDISGDGLAALAGHVVLTKLSLAGTAIDDDDLAVLQGMPALKEIDLEDTQVGDGAWAVLATMPTLHTVDMSHTNVTDDGVATLPNWPNFGIGVAVPDMPSGQVPPNLVHDRRLAFRGTAITDRSLEVLGTLRHLRWLDLADTAVTDEGLRHLEGLDELKHIDLSGTSVTAEGIKRLREALPDTNVVPDQSPQ